MKFMQKMLLVPAGRVPLEISTMSDLDLTNVINNKNLTAHEKISQYSRILKKNLTIEENLWGKNSVNEVSNDEHSKNAKQIKVEPKIEPIIDVKKEEEKIVNDENEDIDLSELFKMEPEIDVKKEKKKKNDDDDIVNLSRLFKEKNKVSNSIRLKNTKETTDCLGINTSKNELKI